MKHPQFVLDANVFIEAKNRYYAFDVAPGFWDGLIHHGQAGHLVSIDKVKAELLKGKDQLKDWCKEDFADYFKGTSTQGIANKFEKVVKWVYSQSSRWTAAEINAFMSVADGWVIAYAMETGAKVVTHEKNAAGIKGRVKIPDVCDTLSIPYTNTFEMMRHLKIQLNHR